MPKRKTHKTNKKSAKTLKPRKGAWFVKVRHSYLPASPIGWLLYVPLAAAGISMLVGLSESIDHGAGVGLTLSEFALGLIFLGLVYTWIAEQKS